MGNFVRALKNIKIPGIAPTAFMIPKTLPECLGAKSCGFTNTAALWKPAQNKQSVINIKAKMNDEFPYNPEI